MPLATDDDEEFAGLTGDILEETRRKSRRKKSPKGSGRKKRRKRQPVYLARRSSRFVAAMADGFINVFAIGALMAFFGFFDRFNAKQVGPLEFYFWLGVGFLFYVAIHGFPLATRGQSLGKMLIGVRIVDFQTDELVPLWKILGLRILPIQLLSMLPFLSWVPFVDVLFIFNSEQQCLHDLIAGTKIVEA